MPKVTRLAGRIHGPRGGVESQPRDLSRGVRLCCRVLTNTLISQNHVTLKSPDLLRDRAERFIYPARRQKISLGQRYSVDKRLDHVREN